MKKVKFYVSVRPLGETKGEFFVEDNTSEKEIRRMVEDELELFVDWQVEAGYHVVQKTEYVKKDV